MGKIIKFVLDGNGADYLFNHSPLGATIFSDIARRSGYPAVRTASN
jgi:predicted AlkP superfamily pyrophosphatase or phosphodiesterase